MSKSTPQKEIDRLANYLLENYPEEIVDGSAVDVAIRLMKKNIDITTGNIEHKIIKVTEDPTSQGRYRYGINRLRKWLNRWLWICLGGVATLIYLILVGEIKL